MIRAAIFGYGNLGRGTLRAVLDAEDMKPVGVFTRREKAEVCAEGDVEVFSARDILEFANKTDVLFVCGGSADDLPTQTPFLAEYFNVVDSFDRHAEIKRHFDNVNYSALRGKKLALISAGWDPGLFSAARAVSAAVFPSGKTYTFWGEGVSQGHSEAVRRIGGVKDAVQVTVPNKEAVESAQNGTLTDSDTRKTHTRHCFVVAEEGADRERIKREIRSMPDYFAGYETAVDFVTESELHARFSSLYHGGEVISHSCGTMPVCARLSLSMKSNPDFTGALLAACGRAVYREAKAGKIGAMTVLDVPAADMLPPSVKRNSLL